MKKRLKQVNEIAQSPDYRGQEIYLQVDDDEDTNYFGDSDEGSEPITVVLDTITSENTVDVVSSYPERIITTVKINDTRSNEGWMTFTGTSPMLQESPMTSSFSVPPKKSTTSPS